MKRIILPAILTAPILLAWGLSAWMFQSGPLSGHENGWEGYGEVFMSYAIMFCIATWVPLFLFWLIARNGGWRSDE